MSEIEIISLVFFSGVLILAFCGIAYVEAAKRKQKAE